MSCDFRSGALAFLHRVQSSPSKSMPHRRADTILGEQQMKICPGLSDPALPNSGKLREDSSCRTPYTSISGLSAIEIHFTLDLAG